MLVFLYKKDNFLIGSPDFEPVTENHALRKKVNVHVLTSMQKNHELISKYKGKQLNLQLLSIFLISVKTWSEYGKIGNFFYATDR